MRRIAPLNFDISSAARDEMIRSLSELSRYETGEWLVAVVWIENEKDITDAGPSIAFYERARIDPEMIVEIAGLELVFALNRAVEALFDNKVLDFESGRFFLR